MPTSPQIDVLVERYLDSESPAAAEAALLELAGLAPPGFTIEDALLGDHLAELAAEAHEDDDLGDALRLQAAALEHECLNVVRETAVLAALRYEEAEASGWPTALDRFTSARDRADAFSAFASTVIFYDIDLAFTLHDDALDLALKTKDDELLARVSIPRMLDRSDHDYAPDEPDEYAADILEDFDGGDAARDSGPVRFTYLPRAEHPAALERWPAAAAEQEFGTDAYFQQIEADCGIIATHRGRNPELVPVTVALLVEHGASLDDDEFPPSLNAELATGSVPLTPWPPGRNDPCWCASGRKYKRCCG